MRPIKIASSFLILLFALQAFCQGDQNGDIAAFTYIEKYKEIAIHEMNRTGIPASIKLGQGLLESSIGKSRLAVLANNHFGAKCHNSWWGDYILHDDDALNERFRKYECARDSYEDHSMVLAKERYSHLFALHPEDYKGWAFGLKAAGYATDPKYAYKLINIIERYDLHVYDKGDGTLVYRPAQRSVRIERTPVEELVTISKKSFGGNFRYSEASVELPSSPKKSKQQLWSELPASKVEDWKGVAYVKYEQEVHPVQIADTYGLTLTEVLRFNSMDLDETFPEHNRIYLEELRNKARGVKIHIVQKGERMAEISRLYAVSLETLYERNMMIPGTEPMEGESIYLRKPAPFPPAVYAANYPLRLIERHKRKFFPADQDVVTAGCEVQPFLANSNPFVLDSTDLLVSDELHQIKLDGFHLYSLGSKKAPLNSAPSRTFPNETNQSAANAPKRGVITGQIIEKDESAGSRELIHEVIAKETLWSIANRYGLTVDFLKQSNGLEDNTLHIGQKIKIVL